MSYDSDRLDRLRDDTGQLPSYAWPGGYPVVYYTACHRAICPACANDCCRTRNKRRDDDPRDGYFLTMYHIHYEGDPIECEECGVEIESAYGNPEEEEEDE
jgi:hypothetical protein